MDDWDPHANEVFLDAIELPTDEQAAFIANACFGSLALEAKVRALLAAHGQVGDFLACPTKQNGRPAMPQSVESLEGTTIGPYKLQQEIGRGGMGIVYLAEQAAPIKRSVALKIIMPGMDTRHVIARFESERQALALMDHPNITRVFDAGATASGRPYFVMELVEGQPITDFCDERGLTVRQRLELMADVCRAVQHAHQKGVIHRDLKPSNVMIALYDGAPVPKVIDFGVAKAVGPTLTERTLFTEYGAILGTLEYMSPEQAELNQLDVDTRSDIYSLGVLLYELLTGTTPIERGRLKKSSFLDALRTIREEEPVKPSTRIAGHGDGADLAHRRGVAPPRLKALVKGELDWVVMKALEKDRHRRYQTVADLLRDIESYLDDRPVHARPVSVSARAFRWCRRNRYIASLLAVVASLLAAITIVATVSAIRLRREGQALNAANQLAVSAERSRRQELVGVYTAEAKATSQRTEGAAAIRGALAALSWKELTRPQQLDLVNAAIPVLISSAMHEQRTVPLSLGLNENRYHEVDVDPQLVWLATKGDDSQATVLARLDDTSARRRLESSVALPTSNTARRLFSPKGRWILETSWAAPQGWQLMMWDAKTGSVVIDRLVHGCDGFPAFDQNEEHLLLQDVDSRTLYTLEIRSGRRVTSSPPRFRRVHVAYSPDDNRLSLISLSLPPEIVDARTWRTIASFSNIGLATSTAWHPQDGWAAFGTEDGQIYRWRDKEGEGLEPLGRRHGDAIDLLVFSPNGRFLASSDAGRRFMIRRLQDNHVVCSGSGCVLRFSPDSRRIAVRNALGLTVYEIEESVAYRQLNEVADAAEFSPKDRWLAVSGNRGVRLFDARSLQLTADLGLDRCGPVAFHPDEKYATTFGYFSQAWNWPISNNELGPPKSVGLASLSTTGLEPQHDGRHATWSADGKRLVLADYRHNKILCWEDEKNSTREFTSAVSPIQVAQSPDGQWVAANVTGEIQSVVWNTADASRRQELYGAAGVAFSDDNRWFAARMSNEVKLFGLPDWALRHSIDVPTTDVHRQLPPLFQPHGRLVVAIDLSQRVRLFDRETADPVATLDDRDPSTVKWISFSPDGRRLAVTRGERIAIWDLSHLAADLQELGLPVARLAPQISDEPEQLSKIPELTVNRGSLPSASLWPTLWQMLARYEASEGNWPDAIDDLNRGWSQLSPDPVVRAKYLAERGTYFRRNLSFQAAMEDWKEALVLVADESTAVMGLARLCVMGPPEIRDPRRGLSLGASLRGREDSSAKQEARLLQAFARVQLGQSLAEDIAAIEEAHTASQEKLSPDLRLAAAYFLALSQAQQSSTEQAEATLKTGIARYQELRDRLTQDQCDELERLQSEVQSALRSPPEVD